MDLWSGAARDYVGLSRRPRLSFAAERVAEASLGGARVRHVDARREHGFMRKGSHNLPIPNPHRRNGAIALLRTILLQANISRTTLIGITRARTSDTAASGRPGRARRPSGAGDASLGNPGASPAASACRTGRSLSRTFGLAGHAGLSPWISGRLCRSARCVARRPRRTSIERELGLMKSTAILVECRRRRWAAVACPDPTIVR
jgi:hypothetical protein